MYQMKMIEENDYIIDIVRMESTDDLCIITKEGSIYKLHSPDINIENDEIDNWELVGNMDSAVDIASWNYDISTLAVISGF